MLPVQVRIDQNHMATTFEFCISCDKRAASHAEQTLLLAHQKIHQIENEISEFLPSSPVYQINNAPAGTLIPISESLREIFVLAETLKQKSKGAFDPLSKSRVAGNIFLSANQKSFYKSKEGIKLSFGAIGKGYALDQARLLLEQESFSDFLLNAGGSSIVLSGFSAPKKPWNWAWGWQKERSFGSFSHPTGNLMALGVSGIMEQGQHIIDPVQGTKSTKNISALVAHASAAQADALSTALFVSGWDQRKNLYDPIFTTPLALIDATEKVHWNGDFQSIWGPVCTI